MFLMLLILASSQGRLDPEARENFTVICESYGYLVSSHYVVTPDGYILNIFHLGNKRRAYNTGSTVFLQHGLVDSSDDWILNSESLAPAFKLVSEGYDVWLGNTRGNTHSRNHTTLKPTEKAFWDYTWNDVAKYDIPSQVDYILSATGKPKLIYIGHSQGTLVLMVQSILDPTFADKISVAVLLAPIGSIVNQKSELISIFSDKGIFTALSLMGVNELFPPGEDYIYSYTCYYLNFLCEAAVYALADMNVTVDNTDRFSIIMGHYPSSDSVKNLIMYTQMANYEAPKVSQYDYGTVLNLKHYGTKTPPVYDLSKVNAKLALFGGKYDRLADQDDVAWLRQQLTGADIVWYKNDYPLGHGSFLWAKNMDWFDDVLEVISLNQY